ncbi:hypothetical protein [Flavivirga sp. 57AJ16]|uniref:hypothetical protein n=1 Tax=Flavivirga sp. 57AJ16 TaxID=3025307 RepID=UPI002365DF04|nr:hypothetical protein [Flavivirga sp. 57AJ16]MDD7885752.1 hypothetical protein [Flavivirga sp. 57AJ16]
MFNTTNPPEIAGASLENGSEFVEGTDMYLLVYSDADGIKYFYLKVVPNFPLEIVPKESEYVDLSGALDLSVPGACSITNYGTLEEATWDYELDYTRDWSLTFSGSESGLGVPRNTEGLNNIQLIRVSDDAIVIDGDFRTLGQTRQFLNMGGQSIPSSDNTFEMAQKLEIRNVGGSIFMYNNDVLLGDSGVDLTENVRLKLSMDDYNVYDLKLVYL